LPMFASSALSAAARVFDIAVVSLIFAVLL
jgi:hypothetical protein